MKSLSKRILLIGCIAVLSHFCACSRLGEAQDADGDCIYASIADTKVFACGNGTYWNEGDLVSVFFYAPLNECWYFDGADGSSSGKLHASGVRALSRDDDKIVAVYPYSENNSLSGRIARIELPPVQKFRDSGTFGANSAVLGACSGSSTLEFRYLSGFASLRFNESCSIRKITLQARDGRNLSGLCKADFGLDNPVLYDGDCASVMLDGPFEVTAGETLLFSVVPGNYDKGLEWSVQYTNGNVQTVRCAGVEVRPGTVAEPVAVNPDSSLKLNLTFCLSDGSAGSCPFSSKPGKDDVGGLSKAYYLSSDTSHSYPFKFYVQNWTGENLRFTGAGLNIGGTEGDYMLLPGISGKRLSKISMAGRYAFDFRVGSYGPFRLLPEDRCEVSLTDTQAGVGYKLYFGLSTLSDGVCKIYYLLLTYEDA